VNHHPTIGGAEILVVALIDFAKRPVRSTAIVSVAVYLLLSALFWFLGSITSPEFRGAFDQSYLQSERSASEQLDSTNPTRDSGNSFARWAGMFAARTITSPVDLFTGLLFVATLGLWLATLSLLYEARRSSERQLRAYINILSARIMYNPTAGGTWESRIEFRNFGKSPARDVQIFGVLELATWEINETFLKPINALDPHASHWVLGAGAGRTKIDEPYNPGFFEIELLPVSRTPS
jgi:hypothetical protein